MTIRTLGLDSGVTSLQDHRLALGAFMGPGASVLERRGGVYYYPGAADLVSAAALQATVSPFSAVVDGTSNSLQGQVVVVVDAAVTLTFSAGEAAVARTDRVVLQIRDTTYDASGSTDARVLIVKGNTSTGAANSVPASSLLLWEVVVPIGASSITFTSARVDRRQWIATPMRIPVNSSTERDALPTIPGLEVTRLDTGAVEQYWSGAWRTLLPVAAPTSLVLFAYKTSTTTRTSSTSFSDDPHLTVTVDANSIYSVDFYLIYEADAAADLQWNFTAPSGATCTMTARGLAVGQAASTTSGSVEHVAFPHTSGHTVGGAGSGQLNKLGAAPKGVLITGGSSGAFTFRWAQKTSNAVGTILYQYSYMRLEKIA